MAQGEQLPHRRSVGKGAKVDGPGAAGRDVIALSVDEAQILRRPLGVVREAEYKIAPRFRVLDCS